MVISILLVVLVVYLFLRNGRAALIPSVAVPLSLVGTFGVMYFAGLHARQSVADGADGRDRASSSTTPSSCWRTSRATSRRAWRGFEATLLGAREVGFTVLSMSLSLIAVFLPILLMGGIVGRFFNEFAMVLSIAILISLIVSLTTTPMLCANLDLHKPDRKQGWLLRTSERVFDGGLRAYDRSLQLGAAPIPASIMFILASPSC